MQTNKMTGNISMFLKKGGDISLECNSAMTFLTNLNDRIHLCVQDLRGKTKRQNFV